MSVPLLKVFSAHSVLLEVSRSAALVSQDDGHAEHRFSTAELLPGAGRLNEFVHHAAFDATRNSDNGCLHLALTCGS